MDFYHTKRDKRLKIRSIERIKTSLITELGLDYNGQINRCTPLIENELNSGKNLQSVCNSIKSMIQPPAKSLSVMKMPKHAATKPNLKSLAVINPKIAQPRTELTEWEGYQRHRRRMHKDSLEQLEQSDKLRARLPVSPPLDIQSKLDEERAKEIRQAKDEVWAQQQHTRVSQYKKRLKKNMA